MSHKVLNKDGEEVDLSNMIAPTHSVPATPHNKPSIGDFVTYPRDVDVVGTRRRTWHTHPGNARYRQMITQAVPQLLDDTNRTPVRVFAEKIVNIITKDQDAVFLRADEEQGGWFVMDYSSAVTKVGLALKNAEIKARSGGSSTVDPKKRKKVKRKSIAETNFPVHSQDLPPIEYKEGPPPKKVVYRAVYFVKEGAISLDAYTRNIIDLMCNQMSAKEAFTALDSPLPPHLLGSKEESEKERLIRLQLRQRYVGAMTIGLSPVEFSRMLMGVWEGSISQRKVPIDDKSKANFIEKARELDALDTPTEESLSQENNSVDIKTAHVQNEIIDEPTPVHSDANTVATTPKTASEEMCAL